MNTILCVFCAVEMVEKTVFGKLKYRCPKCGREVNAADVVRLPAGMAAGSQTIESAGTE